MLSPEDRASIKTTVGRASKALGGHKVCGASSGRICEPQRFSEYANPQLGERYIPLDVAVEVDMRLVELGLEPLNLANAARLLGKALVVAPQLLGQPRVDFVRMAREASEAIAAAAELADDSRGVPDKLRRAITEIDEAIQAQLEMREALATRLDGGGAL